MNSPYQTTTSKQIYSQNKKPNQNKPGTIPEPAIPGGPSSYGNQEINPPSNIPANVFTGKQTQPLIDLQIYPDPKKSNPLAEKQGMLPLQPLTLSSPFIPPQFQSYLNNFMKNFYTPFIYKDYHINLGGPSGDHMTASLIYEDALPEPEVFTSYKTIKERNALCDYIRGTFIKNDEGEFVDFSGGPNSLNSRLKLIQLNQYNTNLFSANPYKSLPKDLLIYKSCYPIVYDKSSTMVQCNKMAVGLNIRVYKITIKEFVVKYFDSPSKMENIKLRSDLNIIINKIKKELGNKKLEDIEPDLKPYKFDVWREIEYYAFIRNKINSLNLCPNFVQSYCYFINKNANLSYSKNGQTINFDKSKNISEIMSDEFSNSTMILLTESPNQNIYQWSSNAYVQDKGIRKMIYSGYKKEEHWKSIIAQMLIIFYIMEKYNFTVREMDINANFYVKDLNIYGDNKQYWQYTIENIDYYIPNYGHLLMFDHNYKDLKNPENKNNLKIAMEIFEDKPDEIKNLIKFNGINCFSSNNFGESFHEIGGVKIPDKIAEYFDMIQKDIIANLKWNELIQKYFIKFGYIHNRIGTPIRELEINYIRRLDSRPIPFKLGELVVVEEKFETFKILLVIKRADGNCTCITKDKDTNEYIEKEYPLDLLYHYSELETIKQDIKPGEPMVSYEHIIEKYVF